MPTVETFGPFDLIHRIGAGGMAETFLTRVRGDTKGNEFVLKRILPEISGDAESEAAFLEEAKLAASLTHPNIVRSLPAGRTEGRTYIPMEFVFGDDLRTVVQKSMARRQFPPDRFCVAVVAQAARGLAHAHAQTDEDGAPLELVHRDVSPPNLMIGFDGVVRVLDFGIARLRPGASSVRTGQLKGKFAYMSPEQALGIRVDNRSDIFCLGIVLHELLTRRRLFRDDTALKTVRNVSRAQVKPLREYRSTLSEDLEKIVLKALSRRPEDRYSTANEFADALDAYLLANGGEVSNIEIGEVMRTTCGDSVDLMRQLLGEDYAGPKSIEKIEIPSTSTDAELRLSEDTSSSFDTSALEESEQKRLPVGVIVAGVAILAAVLTAVAVFGR